MPADRPNDAALAASRLPNKPNAGYATSAQKLLSDSINQLITDLERNRLLLLEVVIGGKARFRRHFKAAYRFAKADDEAADAVFGYLELLGKRGGDDLQAQKARLEMAAQHARRQRWDHRLRTALALSKDRRALEDAIAKETAQAEKKAVRLFMRRTEH